MSDKDPPVGGLFSRTYLERGKPARDSARARLRLLALMQKHFSDRALMELAERIKSELGVEVDLAGADGPYGEQLDYYNWERFFKKDAELRDILDAQTIMCGMLAEARLSSAAEWPQWVAAILSQEGFSYRVDEKGGIHPLVDNEFERNRVVGISALAGGRYQAALAEFEKAHEALDGPTPDWKVAIRSTFESAEIIFRLLCPKAARLGSGEVDQHLKPVVQRLYRENQAALTAGALTAESLRRWVDGAHQYRHGQPIEEPAPPPGDLAVAMVSLGMAWVRWLAEIDQQVQRSTP